MSTREDQIKRILAKSSADAAVSNDPISATVTPPNTPVPPAPVGGVNQPSSADQSTTGKVTDYLGQAANDVIPAIKRGVVGAANEVAKTADEFGTWAKGKADSLLGPTPDMIDSQGYPYNSSNWMVPGPKRAELAQQQKDQDGKPLISDNATIPGLGININPPAPKTVVGQSIEGITNFVTSMVLASKLTKGLKVLNEAGDAVAAGGKYGALGLNALNGGIATFIGQDPHARNLFNLVGDNFPVTQALTNYFAANPNDSAVEARLRNAAQGMAMGAATDMVIGAAKYIKLNRLWENAPAAAKPAAAVTRDKALADLDAIIQKGKANVPAAPAVAGSTTPTGAGIQRFQAVKNADGTGAVVDTRSARGPAARSIIGPDGKLQTNSATERPGYKPRANVERRKGFTDADLESHGITVTTDAEGNKTFSVPGPNGETQGSTSTVADRRSASTQRRTGAEDVNTSRPNNTEYHPTFEEAQAAASTKNMIEQDKVESLTRPVTNVTPEQTTALNGQIRDLVSPDNPWMGQTSGTDFNLGRVDTDEEAKAALEAVGQVMRPEMDAMRGGATLTNEQLKNGVADLFGESGQDLDKTMSEIVKPDSNPNDLPIRLNAGRLVMDKISSTVVKYSALLADDPENPALLNILAKHMGNLVRVAQVTKGRITSAARATQSGNITTGELGRAVENAVKDGNAPIGVSTMSEADILSHKLQVAIPYMNTDQLQAFARKVQLTQGDPGALLHMLGVFQHATDDQLKQPGFMDKVNFAWVSSILSGPLTTAKNFTGNVFGLGATPVERYLTGSIMKAKNWMGYSGNEGGGLVQQEGADLFTGFFANMRDSFNAAKTSFMTNKPTIESGNLTNEIQNPFQGYLGTAVGVPSRFLMSQDEFFKNLAYRSYVRSKSLREVAEKGLNSKDAAELVAQRMDESLVNGIGLNNNALAFAQKATYTNPLTPGSFGDTLASAAAKHPALRFAALPFVKTPTNLLLWTWDRTPGIALLAKSNREALAAGGERAAEVMSRQATGSLVWGAGVLATLAGTITSGGPKDPVQRKLWEDTGWKPYSVKIGNAYVPYQSADPLLMPLGIISDAVQASREMDEQHQNDFALAFTAAMGRNLASKSYLYGVTDAANALMSGDTNKLDTWMKSRTGSFVPAVFRQTNPDDTMREMRTYTDQVIGNLPGFSESLPPKVSFFGKPIMKAPFSSGRALNPFTPSYGQEDTGVEDKLMVLGRDFSYPSKNYPGTEVDMTSRDYGLAQGKLTPYDRMLQIMANPGGGMPSLRTAIGKITSSAAWDTMSPGVPGIQEGGTRFDKVNGIVQTYRGLAMKRILQEFPAMADSVRTSKVTKKVAEKGGQAALDKLKGYLVNEPNH